MQDAAKRMIPKNYWPEKKTKVKRCRKIVIEKNGDKVRTQCHWDVSGIFFFRDSAKEKKKRFFSYEKTIWHNRILVKLIGEWKSTNQRWHIYRFLEQLVHYTINIIILISRKSETKTTQWDFETKNSLSYRYIFTFLKGPLFISDLYSVFMIPSFLK